MHKFNQSLNCLALELLKKLGNSKPSPSQAKLMESLVSKVAIEQRLSFDDALTNREMTCLLLAAEGKTSNETAHMLGVKASTIKTYHKKIKRKLACTSLAQAVFKGIRYGYVQPESK